MTLVLLAVAILVAVVALSGVCVPDAGTPTDSNIGGGSSTPDEAIAILHQADDPRPEPRSRGPPRHMCARAKRRAGGRPAPDGVRPLSPHPTRVRRARRRAKTTQTPSPARWRWLRRARTQDEPQPKPGLV